MKLLKCGLISRLYILLPTYGLLLLLVLIKKMFIGLNYRASTTMKTENSNISNEPSGLAVGLGTVCPVYLQHSFRGICRHLFILLQSTIGKAVFPNVLNFPIHDQHRFILNQVMFSVPREIIKSGSLPPCH